MLLSNRVAIITGGAKGIGRGIVLKFAEEGCNIVIADISIKEANEVMAEALKKGVKGQAIQCDVTNSAQVKNVVDTTMKMFGKIDILVNNAGGTPPSAPIEEISEELWDKIIALNLKSDFLFCKFIVPYMKEKKYGRIINMSSVGAINPPHHAIHYNSAKAGVVGFTYDLAFGLAPFNINVNAILPGPVRTDFYNKQLESVPDKDVFFANLGKKVPLQRIGTPEDIANAVLFLASDMGSFVTGTTLNVSGGIPLMVNPMVNQAPPKK